MKILKEADFVYRGKRGTWYVFEFKSRTPEGREKIFVKQAKMIMKDGTTKFFDPIKKDEVILQNE